MISQIDQPIFGLFYDFLMNGFEDPAVAAYRRFQVDMAVLLGANRATAESDMLDALNFELDLASVRIILCV